MKRTTAALLVVACGTFIGTFDGAAAQMALPVLHRELGVGVAGVQWVMTAFLLISTAALLPAGRLGDVYGRSHVWRLGLILFAGGSVLCAVAPALSVLIMGRAVQGIGSALTSANAAPILIQVYPKTRRGRALGLGNIAIALGLVTGPAIGSLLTDLVSWRLIFVVAVPVALGAWLPARRLLPDSPRTRDSLDIGSAALSAGGLAGLLLAGTLGRTFGWLSVQTLSFGAVGLLALIAFIVIQRRVEHPLLDPALFADRMFLSGTLASLLGFAALMALTVAMPFFLVLAQGRRLAHAGLIVAVVPIALSAVAPLAGAAADRIGSRAICTAGLTSVAAALAVLSGAGPHTPTSVLMLAMALAGAGLAAFEAPNDMAVLSSLPQRQLGAGTGVLGAMRNLGMTLGVAGAATLLDYGMSRAQGDPTESTASGVRLALWFGVACAALGALAAYARPGRAPHRSVVRAASR